MPPFLSRLLRPYQVRIRDARGQEMRIAWPNWPRLARQGIPRPFRLHFRIIGWRVFLLLLLIGTFPFWTNFIASNIWWRFALKPWMALANADPAAAPSPPSPTPLFAVQIGGVLLMVIAFALIFPAMNRAVAGRYARELLHLRRCPWCAYDLSGADGAQVQCICPECGAVWPNNG